VTGANGWMGKEFIHNWKLRENDARIIPAPRLGPKSVDILAADLAGQEDWTLVHLAFITRERLSSMSVDAYTCANREITRSALELIERLRPTAVVHASSGAVFQSMDTYGELKIEQEELIGQMCERFQIPCINARIWSVSGAFCPKPRDFLFFDLLYQAIFVDEVHIRADHEVLRRYVDAGQFLSLATTLAHLGMSMDLDSGGQLISAVELGGRMIEILSVNKPLRYLKTRNHSDAYYSPSHRMEDFAEKFGFTLNDIDWQIKNSTPVVY